MVNLARQLRVHWRSPRLWMRLAIGFGALVCIMAAVVVLAVAQFRALGKHGEQMMRQDLQHMLQVQTIDRHVQGHGNAMARLLTSPRSERELIYPDVDAEYAAIEGLIAELAEQRTDPTSSRLLKAVADKGGQYREVFGDIVTEIESGEPDKARAMVNGPGQVAIKALLDASLALQAHAQTALDVRQADIRAQIARSEWLLAVLAMAALALSVGLAWRTTRSVTQPLARVEQAAARIADGDYAVRVEMRSGDELDRVAKAMNSLAAAVAAREVEIENVAYVDRLTGLPNRSQLRRLASGADIGRAVVMLIDVARLRMVNEVLGFETGDALLSQMAERLGAVLAREGEQLDDLTLARMHGGVFAMLSLCSGAAAMERLRDTLDAVATSPLVCGGHAVDIELVYGLADTSQTPGLGIDGLLQRAESALGDAKRQRKRWAWFVPTDDALRTQQLGLLSRLRHAAAAGELEMWLQPKQSIHDGRLLGMEALVRWRHPQRGYMSPAEFIPYAEKTGHIGVVTTAMIDAALRTLAAWARDGRDLSIAVNVSALDLRDDHLVEQLRQLALRHGAPLERLRLEITESTVMDDAEHVLPVLHALRALGVQLSLDDFGTGYSSLAYLRRLPVSELKIDRSFVADADLTPGARALLKTIVDLGHSLGMAVTAEGVERAEELALLASLGCDVAQGYLIARPMSPADAARYVATRLPAAPQLLTT